jgi:hypothetical protein
MPARQIVERSTPQSTSVFFVPIGIATEEIDPHLRTLSSLGELENWLNGEVSKYSGSWMGEGHLSLGSYCN